MRCNGWLLWVGVTLGLWAGGGGFGPALADPPQAFSINWTVLDLSPEQESHIQQTEYEWRRMYQELSPQIRRDRLALRHLLNAPMANESQIMALQDRIRVNEERLRMEAMRAFLHKKSKLTHQQRMRLHRMMEPEAN